MCDYRRLNTLILVQQCPVPCTTDFYNNLHGAKLFSIIDLKAGFHQLRLETESRELSAFITPFGLYQWTVVPFGIKTGPANFMSLMYRIFQGLIGDFIFVYVDDILIFSKNTAEHEKHVRIVLDRLRKHGIIAHKMKSHFFVEKVDFLGMEISHRGLRPKNERLRELQAIQLPTYTKERQRYLGIIGYYRQFVKGFAHRTAILYEKLRNKDLRDTLQWNDTERKVFEETKKILLQCPTLNLYDRLSCRDHDGRK